MNPECSNHVLKQRYPDLYSIAVYKDTSVHMYLEQINEGYLNNEILNLHVIFKVGSLIYFFDR